MKDGCGVNVSGPWWTRGRLGFRSISLCDVMSGEANFMHFGWGIFESLRLMAESGSKRSDKRGAEWL